MNGILLYGSDELIESRAKRYGVSLRRFEGEEVLPFEKTLITRPGTAVPWELLPAAWGFLDRWDAAAPLWEYTITAASVGTDEDRRRTQAVIRDLRVLLHATELLFVRRNETGRALVECWQEERRGGGDERLAFLRALYQVKPRLCVLPTSWITAARVTVTALPPRPINGSKPLVKVALGNGRFVKVHAGDETRARQSFNLNNRRRDMALVSKKSFTIDNQKARANKGPLIRIELQPGRFVKMYEADAVEQGYIKPKPAAKSRPPQENKSRPPQEDKQAVPVETATKAVETGTSEPDDFTTISGIGKAAARSLAAHGIDTFERLRAADISFLSAQQQAAVEEWRDG